MGEWHPESPARLQAIEDQLICARLDGLLERREGPLAELPALMRNHTAQAIALVRDNLPGPGEYYPLDADTLLNQYSYQAALRAAGCAMAATDAVIAGDIDNAFCATRPPGHHARPGGAMGFCMFNNVALAALHAFKPEMIFISAGFDAHREDDLGEMGLVEADYAWMTREIMAVAREHAGGRIVSCLEGGYNLSALGRSVAAHVKALAQLD